MSGANQRDAEGLAWTKITNPPVLGKMPWQIFTRYISIARADIYKVLMKGIIKPEDPGLYTTGVV